MSVASLAQEESKKGACNSKVTQLPVTFLKSRFKNRSDLTVLLSFRFKVQHAIFLSSFSLNAYYFYLHKKEASILGTKQGGLDGIYIEIFTAESIITYISIDIAFDVTLFTVY